MAKANDMPEFHSVKVFVTKNTPSPRRRHGITNTSNTGHAGMTSPHGFIGCSTAGRFTGSCFIDSFFINRSVPLTFAGGQAHV
ncbi:hypothetical protein SG34_019705 [Thalassomonas viridans]|uniref:Uncharacterized protein n=1 Tax=Thalassomonas viridans TaxID=137584 RepID=A0AAE9Z1P3_9GAMM|nr:hypothetical protein [Thalassomonas viridans]WDE03593.1 hypothetical protein SG34_019705 [Thalassomonas viridans]